MVITVVVTLNGAESFSGKGAICAQDTKLFDRFDKLIFFSQICNTITNINVF